MLIIVAERGPPPAVAAAPRRVRLDDQTAPERRAVCAAFVQSSSPRMKIFLVWGGRGVGGGVHLSLNYVCYE